MLKSLLSLVFCLSTVAFADGNLENEKTFSERRWEPLPSTMISHLQIGTEVLVKEPVSHRSLNTHDNRRFLKPSCVMNSYNLKETLSPGDILVVDNVSHKKAELLDKFFLIDGDYSHISLTSSTGKAWSIMCSKDGKYKTRSLEKLFDNKIQFGFSI